MRSSRYKNAIGGLYPEKIYKQLAAHREEKRPKILADRAAAAGGAERAAAASGAGATSKSAAVGTEDDDTDNDDCSFRLR